MTSPTLGQPVEFTWHLDRHTEYRQVPGDKYQRSQRWKVWKETAYPGQPEPDPRRGILVGIRTLSNGRAEYEHEAGIQFYPEGAVRFTAYLVAFDLRRAPVYVLPEHLRFRTTDEREQHV